MTLNDLITCAGNCGTRAWLAERHGIDMEVPVVGATGRAGPAIVEQAATWCPGARVVR